MFAPLTSRRHSVGFSIALALSLTAGAHAQRRVDVWMTTADGNTLLQKQAPLAWSKAKPTRGSIFVDDTKSYQTMDGFGHALTGGSAQLLMKMSPGARTALLKELFSAGPEGIGTSYIRVTVGASDMNDHVYTYDDLATGETDSALTHFSLAEDEKDVIPVLQEIVRIQPSIRILATPWTAPAWMKDNGQVKAGSLKPEFYGTYAQYLVRYVQAMRSRGIPIGALTPQNEPENPKNTPSMVMTAEEEANFIGKHLGPALAAAGLKTRIIAFDHNCDHPIYAETVLRDPDAAHYTDGSGFHLYLGEISALSEVHRSFPDKNVYFTEQMVVPHKHDAPDAGIASPVARLMIGAPENWSRNVLLWNLAADPQNGPHTNNGGCPMCAGAITLDGDKVTRLVAYYTVAQTSKFVPPGSIRIDSADSLSAPATNSPPRVAYRTPSGQHVLLVSNPSSEEKAFVIGYKGKQTQATLAAGAVATYIW